jgi:asparagine N-glycosylation enzyme membrane subunit Stt3
MSLARGSRTALIGTLVLVFFVSLWVRGANSYRVSASPDQTANWFSADPDSHYHMRRLDRALASGGEVQVRDPLLAFPEFEAQGGAPIPWPGMYTRVLYTLLSPWAPDASRARAGFVERSVARAPWILGALTSLLVALAAGRLAGTRAALLAGLYHALCFASLRYSRLGNGDHHAWVSLLQLGWLMLAARGLESRTLLRAGRAWRYGLLAGALAGLSLASWVASLLLIAALDLALLWRMFRVPPKGLAGLGAFGVGFHLAAALVICPDVFASPWGTLEIINLSTFHLVFLGVGALACLPLCVLPPRETERGAGRALHLYPRLLSVAALVAGGLLVIGPLGEHLGQGLRWATGANPFMGRVHESQPLGWGVIGGLGACLRWLGWGWVLLPLAWWHAARRPGGALLPFLLATVLYLALALVQRRFAEGLAAPMAVLLGVWFAHLARGLSARRAHLTLASLALTLPLLAHAGTAASTWSRSTTASRFPQTLAVQRERGLRGLCDWLRTHGAAHEAVLAQWDLGHMIEWGAARPTVATNFGLYLGLDSFLDPWRFLTAATDGEAEALCAARRVRHVLLGSDWMRNLDTMTRVLADDPRWGFSEDCLVARLLPCAYGDEVPGRPHPDFLRLVAFGEPLSDGTSAGWIWEAVPGAVLEVSGSAGQVLRARVRRNFNGQQTQFVWMGEALVGADGLARLRVPWSTEDEESGEAAAPLRWTMGQRKGVADVTLQAVLSGEGCTPVRDD